MIKTNGKESKIRRNESRYKIDSHSVPEVDRPHATRGLATDNVQESAYGWLDLAMMNLEHNTLRKESGLLSLGLLRQSDGRTPCSPPLRVTGHHLSIVKLSSQHLQTPVKKLTAHHQRKQKHFWLHY